MADPIEDAVNIGYLLAFAVVAYLVYEAYQAWGDPTSPISSGLCGSLGVSCGNTVPTSGLGALAISMGAWWGNTSVAVDNASDTASKAVQNAVSGVTSVGSLLVPAPPTPAAPS